MAILNQQFDPNAHTVMRDFSPIPDGEYLARITKSEMKKTKNGSGEFLLLEFDIMSPPYTNRKVWVRLNIINNKADTVERAYEELKTISDAIGIGPFNDTNVLHGKPMIIQVEVEPAADGFKASNSVAMYKKAGDMGNAQQAAAQPTQQATDSATAEQAQERPSWASNAE